MVLFSKLTQALSTLNMSPSLVATIVFESWKCPYVIPFFLIAYIGPKLLTKPFDHSPLNLAFKHLTKTAYRLQVDYQSECYNEAFVVRLHY